MRLPRSPYGRSRPDAVSPNVTAGTTSPPGTKLFLKESSASHISPISEYWLLLGLILPLWGLMLWAAGFYRSHRTLPLGEEIWAAMKVSFGGTALLALVIYGLRLEFVSRLFLAVFGIVNFVFLATEK